MPTYEYACEACDHQWEEIQSMKDEPIKDCPACSGDTAKRLISKSSFVLAGGGWAKEGYSNK